MELSEDRSLFPAPVYEIRRRPRIMESFLGVVRVCTVQACSRGSVLAVVRTL